MKKRTKIYSMILCVAMLVGILAPVTPAKAALSTADIKTATTMHDMTFLQGIYKTKTASTMLYNIGTYSEKVTIKDVKTSKSSIATAKFSS